MAREDYFTSTVDGADAFERWHGQEWDDDRPTRSEVEDDDAEEDDDRGWLPPGWDTPGFDAVPPDSTD